MPFLKSNAANFPKKDIRIVQNMALDMGYDLDEESIEIMLQLLKSSLTSEQLTGILMSCKEEIEELEKNRIE